ncbi:hypothetical protein AB4144_54450, partial [Rhizobiaceae sp. 2RAB30]
TERACAAIASHLLKHKIQYSRSKRVETVTCRASTVVETFSEGMANLGRRAEATHHLEAISVSVGDHDR